MLTFASQIYTTKMHNLHPHIRVICLMALIASLQVTQSSAFPFDSQSTSADARTAPQPLLRRSEAPPTSTCVDSTYYTTLSSSTSCADDTSPTSVPVKEIGDGRIEAQLFAIKVDTVASMRGTASLASRNNPDSSTTSSASTVFIGTDGTIQPSSTSVTTSSTALTNSGASTTSSPSGPTTSLSTTIPENSLTSLTTSEVQTATAPPPTNTTGTVQTTLETSGNPSTQPFPTSSLATTRSLSLVDTSTLGSIAPTATANITAISANDIFQPIATAAPPPQISQRSDHPVPRLGIREQTQKLETNKFYANFFLGDQTSGTWTHPYSLSWSKGSGQTGSWGIAVSHVERSQLASGPKASSDAGDWAFFASPVGIQSLALSAVELTDGTNLTIDTLEAFSVNVNLVAAGNSTPTITFPLVQGMGFVTAIYTNGTPLLQSGVGIKNITYVGSVINGTTYKYSALLADGYTWLIYITPQDAGYQQNLFTLVSPVSIQGPSGFGGYIQIAKVSSDTTDSDTIYDGSAGAYATSVGISGSVDGTVGTYSLSWTKKGAADQPLLIFALPHHIESFAQSTTGGVTDLQLVTTTKGMATAVQGDSWTLTEPNLPIDMSFAPWSPSQGSIQTLPPAAIEAITAAGTIEIAQDIAKQTDVGSMYYDGKALAKFAAIIYVLHEMADNATLALTGLVKLEDAFAVHVKNTQTFPLVYDTAWGGAVSISTYLDGNPGDDFGNTYYNDHHFHFGYFLYAAAVIGYLDPSWLDQGTNRDWVNMLTRDFANPVSDSLYPFSRSFDWYMGHSWAKGLFESSDGKDQESSSEDTMASYAIKMWGKVTNDKNMEARGNLMLAIQARSLSNYFLFQDNNIVEPAQYIGNKVPGITFENKMDHTTYFGNSVEYIQGIHMIPLMPMSTLVRSHNFVQQEWDAYNFGQYAATLDSGWRGILMANLAIIDPQTSYDFFSNATGDFTMDMLDGGASQTWYLAWSAALGGNKYISKH